MQIPSPKKAMPVQVASPKKTVQLQIPSPKKTKQLWLPARALEVNTGSFPTATPSPMSRPVITPQNAASTHWRTVVCPKPPMKHCFRRPSIDVMADDSSSSGGLCTPANLWPTPHGTPMGTPTAAATPKNISLGFGELTQQCLTQPPSAFARAVADAQVQQNQWAARLQTISDTSPSRRGKAFGYPSGGGDMDVSMEVTEDMVTPSPNMDRMVKSPMAMEWSSSLGPATPDDKPAMMCRSEQFRCN